jgi:hypothetical protein
MSAGVCIENDVVPIFVVMKPDALTPALFRGTGFLIAPHILVTCWHCISASLESGQQYAAVVEEQGAYSAHFLLNMEQHPLGLDLAIAEVDLAPRLGLRLSPGKLSPGDEVMTYGYPLTDRLLTDSEHFRFHLNARFLYGYVTRSYYYNHPGFVRTNSYELDMPLPHSLRGAPVIKLGTRDVAGVFFDSMDIPRTETLPGVAGEAKPKQPRSERVASFGLAHCTDSLWSLRGTLTEGRPLNEYLRINSKFSLPLSMPAVSSTKSAAEPAPRPIPGAAEARSSLLRLKEALDKAIFKRDETRIEAQREELLRRLEQYRQRLAPQQMETLKRERELVEQLQSMYPGRYLDSDT